MLVAAAALISTCTQAAVTPTRSSTVGAPDLPGQTLAGERNLTQAQSSTVGAPDLTAPTGTVGGVRSPVEAGSTLSLTIDAYDSGSGLERAEAAIDGNADSVSLCTAAAVGECPKSASDVALSIDVGGEGSHELVVTVSDAAGNTATLVEQTIEVRAPRPPSGAGAAIAVGIAGGSSGPPGRPPQEEPPRKEPPSTEPPPRVSPGCRAPMLAMHLASKPLRRRRHGVPVLRRGRRYLFAGALSCLRQRKRVPAPDGTLVQVRYRHRCMRGLYRCTLTAPEGTIAVKRGRLKVRLLIRRPGAIVFRYRPRQAGSLQVSLRIAVAHRRHRHHWRLRPGHPRRRR
jgi:hypothetical protein